MTTIDMMIPDSIHSEHIVIVRRDGEGSTLLKLSTEELLRMQAVLDNYTAKNVRSPSIRAIVTEKEAA